MIIKFKIFESINILPKIDDYVIIKIDKYGQQPMLQKFYTYNIGQIANIDNNYHEKFYFITFENVPDEIIRYLDKDNNYNYTRLPINDFEYWSDNKEELEVIMNSKKYNL